MGDVFSIGKKFVDKTYKLWKEFSIAEAEKL
jgi:hypothetical protein